MANTIIVPSHLFLLNVPNAQMQGGIVAGTREINIQLPNTTLVASTVKLPQQCAFTVASVLSLLMIADQACTVYTNSSGSPVNTISLSANDPWYWSIGSPFSLPGVLTADVTELFISCTLATNFWARILTS